MLMHGYLCGGERGSFFLSSGELEITEISTGDGTLLFQCLEKAGTEIQMAGIDAHNRMLENKPITIERAGTSLG